MSVQQGYACDVAQTELVTPVKAALDHYVRLQEEMELERPSDEDGAQSPQHHHHQQLTQSQQAVKPPPQHVASSVDADYKFKEKIVARPSAK